MCAGGEGAQLVVRVNVAEFAPPDEVQEGEPIRICWEQSPWWEIEVMAAGEVGCDTIVAGPMIWSALRELGKLDQRSGVVLHSATRARRRNERSGYRDPELLADFAECDPGNMRVERIIGRAAAGTDEIACRARVDLHVVAVVAATHLVWTLTNSTVQSLVEAPVGIRYKQVLDRTRQSFGWRER